MKQKGFTLVELLAVITILVITITIVAVKVDNNIKDANKFSEEQLTKIIEDAAYVYANNYSSELTNLEIYNVDSVNLATLVSKGLIDEKVVANTYLSNKVIIVEKNGVIKVKYIKLSKPTIFLNGPDEISLYKGDTYNEMGAYVAIEKSGIIELQNSNITSNLDVNTEGKYEVSYSYEDAITEKRIVNVINK